MQLDLQEEALSADSLPLVLFSEIHHQIMIESIGLKGVPADPFQ